MMHQQQPVGSITAALELLTPLQLSARWGGRIRPKTLANWRSRRWGPAFRKERGKILYPVEAVRTFELKEGITPCLRT